jgi:hypothetical protein
LTAKAGVVTIVSIQTLLTVFAGVKSGDKVWDYFEDNVLIPYNLGEKQHCVVTDEGANLIAAFTNRFSNIVAGNIPVLHGNCGPHMLNCSVQVTECHTVI